MYMKASCFISFKLLLVSIFLCQTFTLSAIIDIDITAPPYNAIPNDGQDDSPAFQLALEALRDNNGGRLYIPSGGFAIDMLVSITIKTSDEVDGIMIEGELNTNLFCRNPDGFLEIFFDKERHCQVTLKNLSVVAANISSSSANSSGTAIKIYHLDPVDGWLGLAEHRAVACTNVKVRNLGSCTDCYFDQGFVVTGLYRPYFINCQFISPITETDLTTSNIPTVGFDVEDCYYPSFDNCTVHGSDLAFSMNSDIIPSTNPTIIPPEAGAFKYCKVDKVNTGILAEIKHGREPTIWVTNCEIKARVLGIRIEGRRIFHITDNAFTKIGSSFKFNDIDAINSSLGFILNNRFLGNSPNRKNIIIDEDSNHIIIQSNALSGTIDVDPLADGIMNNN